MSITEIIKAVKDGANLEALLPKDADLSFWQRLVSRVINNPKQPRRKAAPRRPRSGKPSRRTNYAVQVLYRPGQAMAEQVARVNGESDPEQPTGEVRFVTVNGMQRLEVW